MQSRTCARGLALVVVLGCVPALAAPPAHAPAHGWRKKHDPYYVGYTGKQWSSDYGVRSGHCDAVSVGAVVGATVGGVAGGALGKEVGGDTGMVIGSIVGALIGGKIGNEIDDTDRGCVSHALDLGETGRPVDWVNPTSGRRYAITPYEVRKRDGLTCRDFAWNSGQRQTACLAPDGRWQIRG